MFFKKPTPEQLENRRLLEVYKSLILHKELILQTGSASQLASVDAVINSLLNQFTEEFKKVVETRVW